MFRTEGTELLGGLELGGIPIATMVSARAGLPALFVRKQAKEYGTAKLAEGPDVAGRRVTIIEDVITTGGAVRDATNALRDYEAARAAADGVRGPVARLGATVLRIDATAAAARDNVTVGEFAAAQAAADLTVERAGWAARVVLAIVAGAVLLLLALVACVIAIGRRARLRRGAAPAPLGR